MVPIVAQRDSRLDRPAKGHGVMRAPVTGVGRTAVDATGRSRGTMGHGLKDSARGVIKGARPQGVNLMAVRRGEIFSRDRRARGRLNGCP